MVHTRLTGPGFASVGQELRFPEPLFIGETVDCEVTVVGKKEAESHSVSIRRLGSESQTVLPLAEALATLVDEATPPDLKRTKAAA